MVFDMHKPISVPSDFEPVFCPVLKKDIDPCNCYEARFGISNILESAGVADDDVMKVCRANCKKIRRFVEKLTR